MAEGIETLAQGIFLQVAVLAEGLGDEPGQVLVMETTPGAAGEDQNA